VNLFLRHSAAMLQHVERGCQRYEGWYS
jgi:hypothetical protein